jgi:hypothetical protein
MPYVPENFLDSVRTQIVDATLASNQLRVRLSLMALLTDIEESVTAEPPKIETPEPSEGMNADELDRRYSLSGGAFAPTWGGLEDHDDYDPYAEHGSHEFNISDIPF